MAKTSCLFVLILKQISDDHQYPDEPFAVLADFKLIIEKAKRRAHHEHMRSTLGSPSTKLFDCCYCHGGFREQTSGNIDALLRGLGNLSAYASTNALFECVDFHGLSQIIASLTRASIAEREAAAHNVPWTQTEKRQRLGQMQTQLASMGFQGNRCSLCLHAVTDEEGHPLEDED